MNEEFLLNQLTRTKICYSATKEAFLRNSVTKATKNENSTTSIFYFFELLITETDIRNIFSTRAEIRFSGFEI